MSVLNKNKLEKDIYNNIDASIKKYKISNHFTLNKKQFIQSQIIELIQEKIQDLINAINIIIQNAIEDDVLKLNSKTLLSRGLKLTRKKK